MQILVDEGCWSGAEPDTEALLDRWLVTEGSHVDEGQTVAEVVLVKATFEIPAPATGTITKVLVQASGSVARGVPIAEMSVDGA